LLQSRYSPKRYSCGTPSTNDYQGADDARQALNSVLQASVDFKVQGWVTADLVALG